MRYSNSGKWFSLAVFSLGIGGFFAFLVGMSRAPGISEYLPENYFQHALVGHVDLAILCWLMISAIVLWIYYLKEEVYPWSYWLAVLGVDLIVIAAIFAIGEPSLNNYVPILDSWIFFLGLGLFFTAFCANAYGYLKIAIRNPMPSDPIMNGIATSLLICVILVTAVAVSFILLGGDDFDSQAYYERLFWTPGHIQQFLNGAMLIVVWYSLLKISTGKDPQAWGFLDNLNKILIASSALLLGMLFFYDPLDRPLRIGAEIIYAFGLGLPLFFHIVNILRQYKFNKSDPTSVGLIFSILVYLYGIFIAYGGFGDDTRVPAHYHGAVTALTLALMTFGYNLIREHGVKVYFERLAKAQPYIYGIGMLIFISGLFVSGLFGAPRKTYGTDWTDNPVVLAALGLMGVGTLMAVIGGVLFVLYAGTSILKGGKEDGAK